MRLSLYLFLAIALLFTTAISSCDSTTSADITAAMIKEGYIKGTVQTKRENGQSITYEFNFPFREGPLPYAPVGGYVYLERYESMEAAWRGNDYGDLEFQITDTMPNLTYLWIENEEAIAFDTTFYNYVYGYQEEADMTEYSYDSQSNTIKGKFIMTTNRTRNGQQAIVNGSFEAKVTKYDEGYYND